MIFSKQQLAIRSAIIAGFVGVVFLIIDTQRPDITAGIRSQVHAAMSPIYSVAEKTRFTQEKVRVGISSKTALHRENQALKAKLAQANVYLQKYAKLSAENAHLRGMLNFPTPVDGRVDIASVIGIDNNPLRQILVLNRGKKHGVYVGQTVLDESGIMGQIINVYGSSSRAMLISDGDHSIAVKIARTGVRAVVTGNGDSGSLTLNYVPNTADLQVGDKIVTSGLGQRFPSGYAVGVVSFIDRVNKHEFIRASIKPSAQLSADNYVMLLYPHKRIALQYQPPQDDAVFGNEKALEADAAADHRSNVKQQVVNPSNVQNNASPSGTRQNPATQNRTNQSSTSQSNANQTQQQ